MSYSKLIILQVALIFLGITTLSAQPDYTKWQQDIDFLFKELEIRHGNLYHTIQEDSLNYHIQQLKSDLNQHSREGILFEIEKVLVKINDGHTGIFPPYNKALNLHRMPLYLLKLEGELVVANATEDYRHLLGLKLVEINGRSVKKISKMLKEFIIHDNEYGQERGIAMNIVFNELLNHVGVPADEQIISIVFEDSDGIKVSESLNLIENESFEDYDEPDSTFADQRWLNTAKKKFWYEVIENNILYIQLNSSDIDGLEEEMQAMIQEIIRLSSTSNIQKIALDIRRNAGGSISRTNPLLEALIAVNTFYPDKQLFVLTSNFTFSAAGALAASLENYTNAVFVGSPTGGKPNGVGDLGWITMPNSQIRVRYSRLVMTHSESWNASPAVFPDLKASITYEDFISGTDPALEAIKNYTQKKDFQVLVREEIEKGDIGNIIAIYKKYKETRFNEFIFEEQTLNSLGIEVYGKSEIESALPIFELNVAEYPWYPTAHNNLGEIYMELGKKEQAMQHYKKAFQLHKAYDT